MTALDEVWEVRERLRTDTPFWAAQCAWILNERKQRVRLIARPWQARTPETPARVVPLDEALEKQRLAGQPQRAIVLKARKLGFCLDPATRVLTADLRWVPIDSVRAGDRLVGCDEEPSGGGGNARKMRVVTVEARRDTHGSAYRLTLDNGATVIATPEHRFLCRWGKRTEARWGAVGKVRIGDRIRHVASPWDALTVDDSAWWDGGEMPHNGWSSVVSIERLPVRRMVDLQTDRATFIAEGLVSHNSTWVQAKFLQRVSQFPNSYSIAVAHRHDAASQLYDIAQRIYEGLPTDRELAVMLYGTEEKGPPFSVRPERLGKGETRAGSRWMVLGQRMRRAEASVYETMTAGSAGGGRSSTPDQLHLSEAAHYDDPMFLVGVLNAVPKVPETIVVIESTANGFNHFHERWQRAVAGQEDPETGGTYVPLFYGWQDNPFNSRPFPSEQARDRFERTIGDPAGGGDDEEPWLIETFGCTLEQLFWRRLTRDEECGGDIEMLHQEHPATPEQAFIGSGRPVFPAVRVAKMLTAASKAPEPVSGVLRGADWVTRKTRAGSVLIPRRALWVPPEAMTAQDVDKWGLEHKLLVWEHPVNAATQQGVLERKPDGQYVVFSDVAEGVGPDADFHAVQVLDHVTRLQVARYRSRIPIHDLPILLVLIGLYFNEAWLAVEKNSLGVGVVDALAKDYRYRYLYRNRRPGDDPREDAAGRRVGWETTIRTKPLMEQTFGEALKSGDHGLRDVATGREATTYVEDEKNPARHGAQKGAHDDLFMAFMGAHRVAAELSPRRAERKAKRPRRGVDPITGW